MKTKLFTIILAGVLSFSCTSNSLTDKAPLNAKYKNPSLSIDERVEDLIKRMTLLEKIGQMTQIEKGSIKTGDIALYNLGSVLSGGGGSPNSNTPKDWSLMVEGFQKEALSTRLSIPIIYGIDAVHGNNNLKNATIFPHNIALGASHDEDLVRSIGKATAEETLATGILWNFAPCLALAQDPRWGRSYESYSEETSITSKLGSAYIEGFQSLIEGSKNKTIACAKHFLGDGGTSYGSSKTDNYKIDQGNTTGSDEYLRSVLLPPYEAAIKSGVRTIMISFSSWNGLKMHAQKDLITGVLKNELQFTGFIVSDWGGIDQISFDYYKAVVDGINAGIDMNMVPYDAKKFIQTVNKAVTDKAIPMSRIDDAVKRILRVKFEAGLFDNPIIDAQFQSTVRSKEHLALAREAVVKSLVILKNENVLPLQKNSKRIYVAGNASNNIGIQCGGWTIDWQGKSGNITLGTTILNGIEDKVSTVEWSEAGDFTKVDKDSICILVLGELPYAEGKGDTSTLTLMPSQIDLYKKMQKQFSKVIIVLVIGRPLILPESFLEADALVCAWLPGTEASGVADVLYGDVKPTGTLSFTWPKTLSQLPLNKLDTSKEKPLFPIAYGLSYK